MWLGIVLHVSVLYMSRPSPLPWHDDRSSPVADLLVAVIHAFRMPLFFILAGFFVAALVQRHGLAGMVRADGEILAARAARKFGIPFTLSTVSICSIEDVAERSWTVCAASSARCAPALHPPGAVEKIKQLSPYRNWPAEEALIRGGEVQLAATVGHTLRDVQVADSHLYCGGFEWHGGAGDSPLWLPPAPREPELAHATLASTSTGTLFFGCLLLDDLPLELLARDPADAVSMVSKPSGHEAGYRAMLGLPPKKVVRRVVVKKETTDV